METTPPYYLGQTKQARRVSIWGASTADTPFYAYVKERIREGYRVESAFTRDFAIDGYEASSLTLVSDARPPVSLFRLIEEGAVPYGEFGDAARVACDVEVHAAILLFDFEYAGAVQQGAGGSVKFVGVFDYFETWSR
jgi:hypothetical protein